MNKILLIIKREYLTKVKKKAFLIATIGVPILLFGIQAGAIYLAVSDGDDLKKVQVIDESGLFKNVLKDDKKNDYTFVNTKLDDAKKTFVANGVDALVYIPQNIVEEPKGIKMFAEKTVNQGIRDDVENSLQAEIRNIRLTRANIDIKVIEANRVDVEAETFTISEEGKEESSSSGLAMAIGGIIGFVLYFTILMSGSQVMMGVIEEKSSRIVEVIISSVRPTQLLMGKIIGIGLVGLTQFMLWIVMFFVISTVATGVLASRMEEKIQKQITSGMSVEQKKDIEKQVMAKNPLANIQKGLERLPVAKILFCFLFFYLGGYILYSSLYAAVGAAVENIQDAQQFSLPLTIPIIISFMFAQGVMKDPDGQLAFWASIIPFTSPINMMVRLPFGVPTWQLILSMVLLVLGFMGTTWFAGRIYRVGILMFGKKPTWKELGKWIFYKG
jgi:ABC-2 type transport system permease protein